MAGFEFAYARYHKGPAKKCIAWDCVAQNPMHRGRCAHFQISVQKCSPCNLIRIRIETTRGENEKLNNDLRFGSIFAF